MTQATVPPKIPLEMQDFSGGITDQDMLQDPTRYRSATNLWCTINRKLKTRAGSQIYNSTDFRTLEQLRINSLVDFKAVNKLLIGTVREVYLNTTDTAGANRLKGPGDVNSPFTAGGADNSAATANHISGSEWNSHMFLTNDSGARTIKILNLTSVDERGGSISTGMAVRTAGLPKIADALNTYTTATLLAACITMANEIRTDMLAHFANIVESHIVSDTVSSALVDATAIVSEAQLIGVTISLVNAYKNHFNDLAGARSIHLYRPLAPFYITYAGATAAQQTVTEFETPTTTFECAQILDDLKLKYNTHNATFENHKLWTILNIVSTVFIRATKGPTATHANARLFEIANDIKSRFNAHIADTPGQNRHVVNDATNTVTSANATSDITLANLVSEMVFDYGRSASTGHDGDTLAGAPAAVFHTADLAGFSLLNRPNGNLFLNDISNGVQSGDIPNLVGRLNDLTTKISGHIEQVVAHNNFSVDTSAVAVNTERIDPFLIDIGTWSYAFLYEYTYRIDGVDFIDFGPPLIKTFKNIINMSQKPLYISGIQGLSNANFDAASWDTASPGAVRIAIYRTVKDGATFYKLDTITNVSALTDYTDYFTDAEVITREPLYTAGGVAGNDPPPIAKYLHIVDATAFYGNVKDEDGNPIPQRLQQAKSGDPDSCPGSFFIDFPDEVKCVNSVRSRLIVGTTRRVYLVQGLFDDKGNGGMSYEAISEGTGIVANASFVQAEEMGFFAGTDTFYMTDGQSCVPLADWYTLYASIQNKANIQGVYDKKRRMVHWAVQLESASGDNDAILTLDLNQPYKPLRACFTYAQNGTSFRPTVVGVFSDQLLRGDTRGYMFKHDDTFTTDPEVDTAVNPATWRKLTITHDYKSPFLTGTDAVAKWGQSVAIQTIKESNLSLDVIHSNDLGRITQTLKPILLRTTGYDQATAAGITRPHMRSFPSQGMRFFNKQIRLTNNKAVIRTYETTALVSINAIAKTATLASGSWASDDRNYFIAFERDKFITEYLVTSVAGGVLTYSDAGNTSVTAASQRWVLRGYPKDEILHLQSIVLYSQPLQPQQSAYPGKVVGDL